MGLAEGDVWLLGVSGPGMQCESLNSFFGVEIWARDFLAHVWQNSFLRSNDLMSVAHKSGLGH